MSRLTDLVQSTDHPSLGQGQLPQGPRAAEVCLGQAQPLLIIKLLQVEQNELAGVPQLVGEVAAGHQAVHGQVQILPRRGTCTQTDVAVGTWGRKGKGGGGGGGGGGGEGSEVESGEGS